MTGDAHRTEVAVVGGGLAGLAAATMVARAGRSVDLFEKAPALGGRAATREVKGFCFNLGPHALYRNGRAEEVLAELGVRYTGNPPATTGGLAVDRGAMHALPGDLRSLLTTSLFGVGAKLETARLLGRFPRLETRPLDGISLGTWAERSIRRPEVRNLVYALSRLTSYTSDPGGQSAGAAIAQIQHALRHGVTYLDGGWQPLVDGLRESARAAGVRIHTSHRVVAIEGKDRVEAIRLAGGAATPVAAAIVAAAPAVAAGLVAGPAGRHLRSWADTAVPVEAACLDVALSRLPVPRALFALGIDRPLYLSVHSAAARLAPEGQALIHVAKYRGTVPSDAKDDEREVEKLLDLVQPGWRAVLVERSFLPRMTVTCDGVKASAGGLSGRPGPAVPGMANLFVAGDWVGPEGMLADAALASAARAAELVVAAEPRTRVAA